MNTMLITFFKGTVHSEFIPQGQTVNQAYYMEILKWICEALHRKMPELWPKTGFSTITMLQLMKHYLSSSFWARNLLLKWNTLILS
jgi:hypothetical protein